jgi:hypothetical protein
MSTDPTNHSDNEKPIGNQDWIEHAPAEGADNTHATIVALASQYVPGSEEEKHLLRKLDFRIIVGASRQSHRALTLQPCVWTLFLLNFIDRANIGFVMFIDWLSDAHVLATPRPEECRKTST